MRVAEAQDSELKVVPVNEDETTKNSNTNYTHLCCALFFATLDFSRGDILGAPAEGSGNLPPGNHALGQ